MKSPTLLCTLSLVIAAFLIAGCANDSSPGTPSGPETAGPPDTMDAHADHVHPSEGPHHGDLVELGNEEYHAEILHDESGTVTIYILDGSAKKQVAIDATEVTINAKHDGKPEQFKLAASPEESDPEGKSSKFVSNEGELAHHLDEEGAEPKLVLTIDGKSYRGVINHHHDHAGHDH